MGKRNMHVIISIHLSANTGYYLLGRLFVIISLTCDCTCVCGDWCAYLNNCTLAAEMNKQCKQTNMESHYDLGRLLRAIEPHYVSPSQQREDVPQTLETRTAAVECHLQTQLTQQYWSHSFGILHETYQLPMYFTSKPLTSLNTYTYKRPQTTKKKLTTPSFKPIHFTSAFSS